MNCCNGKTGEVVAVIMNVSTSFTATILIYRQGSSARRKYCQPGKFRIIVYKQRIVGERWVFARKIFFNDAKNFYSFRLFLPLFRFAPFSCLLVMVEALLHWTLMNKWIFLYSANLFLFFFGCSHFQFFNHRNCQQDFLFSNELFYDFNHNNKYFGLYYQLGIFWKSKFMRCELLNSHIFQVCMRQNINILDSHSNNKQFTPLNASSLLWSKWRQLS